jgi:CRP-like cAMP-binding protein
MDTRVGPIVNHLLASLPAADYRRLQPHLEIVTLTAGETLFPRSGQFAYFPIDSIVALSYVIEAGVTAMACFVGREGMLGMESPLGTSPRGSRAEVQFGGTALRITAVALRQELNRGGTLHLLLQRYLFALMTQSLQLAVCNQHHGLEQRLCRFLGSLFERMDGDAIYLTQTQLALMMGSRRESITEKSARLKSAGLIHYQRGHLRLVSLRALSERACGCGPIIRDAFAKVSSAADPGLGNRGYQPADRRMSACIERRQSVPNTAFIA